MDSEHTKHCDHVSPHPLIWRQAGQDGRAYVMSRAMAATVCNPLELVKVRMQSRGSRHRSAWDVLRNVVSADGVLGLWKGTVPSAVRTGTSCADPPRLNRTPFLFGHEEELTLHMCCVLIRNHSCSLYCDPH